MSRLAIFAAGMTAGLMMFGHILVGFVVGTLWIGFAKGSLIACLIGLGVAMLHLFLTGTKVSAEKTDKGNER